MPVNEQELNLEGTKERLYTFTYASAVIDAAGSGNMAWLRDSVINAVKAYDIDLTETEDHAKAKEAYKKAFQENLVARGILKRSNTIGGYVLSEDPEKMREFSTLIYNVRCKKKELEVAKGVQKLVKRALKAKEGTLGFIAKELKLGPKTVEKIGEGLLTAIATLQALNKYQDDALSKVRSYVAKDILKLDEPEVVKSIFSNREKEDELLNGEVIEKEEKEEKETKSGDVVGEFQFGSKIWEKATKKVEEKVKGFTKVEGSTVADAYLSEEDKEKIIGKAKAEFENEKGQGEGVVKNCASFMQDVILSQADTMMDAYLDIDKEVNPDGRATFNVEKMKIGARSAATIANSVMPHLISFANVVMDVAKEMTFGRVSRAQLKLSSLLHKGYDKNIAVRGLSKLGNMLVYGIDSAASFLAKNVIPVCDFTKAEYDIRHFNIKEVDERKRGENYAKTYASLNVYRAGKAEYIVGAFSVFDMRPRDRLWAMAYLTAGINATSNGVAYDLPKNGKIGNKQEITDHHDKKLDKKALALYEKYEGLAVKIGYEAALQKMQDEFITLHHQAIDKSEKMRAHMGLEPLSKISHFNRMYDNAPLKEFDYIKVKDVTKEEYQKSDLNKTFDEYDAVYIRDEYTGALQLDGENKLVVASIDENNRAVTMACTEEIVDLAAKEQHNYTAKKEETIEVFEDLSKTILRNDALKTYKRSFENEDVGAKAVEKWRTVTRNLLKTDDYVSVYDVKTKECGLKDKRTGVELKYTNCEPNVMLNDQCVSIKRFARDILNVERENICKTCGISERAVKEVADIADNMTSATRNILTRIDKEQRIFAINHDLKLLSGDLNVEDTLVNMDKRRAVIGHMTTLVKEFGKAENIVDDLEAELKKYHELSKTDPVLALCRTMEPECERCGEYITLKLEDGTEFAMNQNGKLAEFCDELNGNICDLQHEFKKLLIEARNEGVDLSIVPGDDREISDTEPVQDEEQIEER